MISLKLLNEPTLMINEQPVYLKQKRSLAILIYCLFHSPVSRASLCELFWPENEEASARKRLADALSGLNRDCKAVAELVPSLLISNGHDSIKFNSDLDCHCDVWTFKELAQTVMDGEINITLLEQATQLYRGDFLQMFQLSKVSLDFERWINSERARLQDLYFHLMHRQGIYYLQQTDIDKALKTFDRLAEAQNIEDEPEDISLQALRIFCHGLLGQVSQVESLAGSYQPQSSNSVIEMTREAVRNNSLAQFDWPTMITRLISRENFYYQSGSGAKLVQKLLKSAGIKRQPLPGPDYHRILRRAENEASGFGFNVVGTPHLFLVLSTDQNPYSDYLHTHINQKIENYQLVNQINLILDEDQAHNPSIIGRTLELETVLQSAGELAEKENQETIRIRHLWLALLKQPDGLLNQLLGRYGVSCDDCWHRLSQLTY